MQTHVLLDTLVASQYQPAVTFICAVLRLSRLCFFCIFSPVSTRSAQSHLPRCPMAPSSATYRALGYTQTVVHSLLPRRSVLIQQRHLSSSQIVTLYRVVNHTLIRAFVLLHPTVGHDATQLPSTPKCHDVFYMKFIPCHIRVFSSVTYLEPCRPQRFSCVASTHISYNQKCPESHPDTTIQNIVGYLSPVLVTFTVYLSVPRLV